MNTLGVLVTCYNEIRALEFSLPMFRKIYPHSKIYLTTESSNTNFDSLLSLNHIKINHVEDTMYIIKEVNDQNFVEPYFQEKILLPTRAFLTRVKQAIEFCQSDYLLLMDPDTLVRGPLSLPEGANLS